jgi:serine/threonine-protein kinase
MGEVFRARDTRLNRDVAIKVLPAAFAQDAERVARFKREAQILASLNHPNIAAIHGLEEGDGTLALAMECVDGEDLAQRLVRGAIPVDEAIAIAKQIAEALEEAHEHGIVHRDLKPANVKLTADGKVKVLDFGLAKALEGDAATGSPDLSHSPTMTNQGTVAGIILGTAAYMSPEQARGKRVDKRSDIWAFGVVLFEMLAGQRLFHGETVSDTLAAVLTREPDWRALPRQTPRRVRRLLERCLERDAARRLRDIGEARILIAQTEEPADAPAPQRPASRAWAIAAPLAAALAGGALVSYLRPAAPQPGILRLSLTLPTGQELRAQARQRLALSPDGSRLVYSANLRLRMRAFDALETVELPGTDDGHSPFFSPNGEWLGFVAGGNMKKMRLASGAPTTIAPVEAFSASWGPDDTILVGAGYGGILRVPAAGGTPEVVVAPEPTFYYTSPRWLPDGKSFLYTRSIPGALAQGSTTMLRVLSENTSSQVLTGGTQAQYLASGHLVYGLEGAVGAVAFDLRARKPLSAPVRLVENVASSSSANITYFALSDTGTFAYVPAATSDLDPSGLNLVAVTRTGVVSRLPLEPRLYSDPRVSPDGRSLAVHLQNDQDDVWVADLTRGSLARQSFDGGEDETPVWSPDGRAVTWSATRPGVARAVLRRSLGGGAEETLWRSERHVHVRDYTPDGRTLLLELQTPKGTDVWRLTPGDEPEAVPFLASEYNERSSRLSPDGRWLAYVSDETGRQEVYVQSFPEAGNKRPVSTLGGVQPIWARDGKAIFYRAEDAIWEAAFQGGANPGIGSPRKLFPDRFESPQAGDHTGWDALPDGRFLMIQAPDKPRGAAARLAEIVLVFNFTEELKAKAPAR